jgi:hypothetical protein
MHDVIGAGSSQASAVVRGGDHGPSHALQRVHASCIPAFFFQPCHILSTLKSCDDLSSVLYE